VKPFRPDSPKNGAVLKSLGLVREKKVSEQIAGETALNPKEER
jgi:hypothetical protein